MIHRYMTQVDFGKVLGDGFNAWKNNLVIILPFLFSVLISIAIYLLAFVLIFVSMAISIQNNITPSSIPASSTNLFSNVVYSLIGNPILLIVVLIVTTIIIFIISSFFSAGAIGMAKEALLKGETNLSDMIRYGKKKYVSFLGANIFVSLIVGIGFLFLLPGLIGLYNCVSGYTAGMGLDVLATTMGDSSLYSSTNYEILSVLLVLIVGLILMAIYVVIMTFLLSLVTYSVVIDDLTAFEGIKKGVRVVLNNKLYTFLMLIFVGIISFAFGLTGSIPYVGGIISVVLAIIFVSPWSTLWYTRFYIEVTKNEHADFDKKSNI